MQLTGTRKAFAAGIVVLLSWAIGELYRAKGELLVVPRLVLDTNQFGPAAPAELHKASPARSQRKRRLRTEISARIRGRDKGVTRKQPIGAKGAQ